MRSLKVGLFLFVWFSCAWFGSWEGNPNNAVRLFAAVSLVERGDAVIDEWAELTIDKARFGPHFYSDKAPGMTLAALPAVAAMRIWTGERSADVPKLAGAPELSRFLLARQWLAAATGPALLTAVAAVLLFDLGFGTTGSAGAGLAGSLAYALGSPVWGWSTTLFGHAAVAALFVIALWAVRRGVEGGPMRPGRAFLAGLALGWAVVVEHQAVLAGTVIALWEFVRLWPTAARWRGVGAFAAGGALALVPLAAYNLVAFGTLWRLGYQGVVGFEGMNQGLFGLTAPSPRVLWNITFGAERGLAWVAPVLVLGALGLPLLAARERGLAWTAAGAAMAVLLVNAAYVYWDGGNSTGPRHATPAAGMMALGVAALWAAAGRGGRVALGAVLGASMLVNLLIAASDVMAPPGFAWPVKTVVWDQRFALGVVRTVPSAFMGWSVWAGLGAYLAVAVPMLAWLAARAGAGVASRASRVTGA